MHEAPARVRVHLRRGHRERSRVELLAADGEVLAEAGFTPRMVSVLLLLADEIEEARRRSGGPYGVVAHGVPEGGVESDAPLVQHAHTAARVNAVYDWCGVSRTREEREPWASTDEVSKYVSRYHDAEGLRALRVPPLLQRHLAFQTTPGHEIPEAGAVGVGHPEVQHWHWATFRALPIEVVEPEGVDARGLAWPFRTIGAPAALRDLDDSRFR